MLRQRVVTALALLALLLPALFYADSATPLVLIILVLVAAGAWEWGRLCGYGSIVSWSVGAFCLCLCALSWFAGWTERSMPWLWTMAGGVWVLGGAALLRLGVSGWPLIAAPIRLLFGVLALWLAWLAVVQARQLGTNFLLSVLALVWVADIGAYFAGRAFGLRLTRSRLASSISPGKSWEGVWGGLLGALVLGFAWTFADAAWPLLGPSFYGLMLGQGAWFLVLAVTFMVSMSVVGDLVESLIKRSAGVKDSSGLLPGHGGVLDRIDALLPTLPLAMMLTHLTR